MRLRANTVKQHLKKDRNAKGFSLDLHMQEIPTVANIADFLAPDEILNIDLSFNYLKTIEPAFLVFHNLKWLDLTANRIRIVENLKNLKNLEFLNLSTNELREVNSQNLPDSLKILVFFFEFFKIVIKSFS